MNFNTRIDRITDPLITTAGVELYIKRDDLIHPYVSGNKLYKLIYNVEEAQKQGYNTLLTFGGAWSNHLVATAAYCKEKGLRCVGVVRGDEIGARDKGQETLSPALKYCQEQGMQLYFISREDYKHKAEPDFIGRLNSLFGPLYLVPEGGANALGVKGASEILNGVAGYNYVCCACGTGTTLAGLIASSLPDTQYIGFSVLKGEDTLSAEVEKYVGHTNGWSINTHYHCGGYAKTTKELLDFKLRFEKTNAIPLDKVYTAKLLYGIYSLAHDNYFETGSKILAIHTGGYAFS